MYVTGYDAWRTDPGPGYVQTHEDVERERLIEEAAEDAVEFARKSLAALERAKQAFDTLRDLDDEIVFPEELEEWLTDAVYGAENIVGHAEEWISGDPVQKKVTDVLRTVEVNLIAARSVAAVDTTKENEKVYALAVSEALCKCGEIIRKALDMRVI